MILKLLLSIQMMRNVLQECNPNKKRKMLIVFHDMITDMLSS